MPHKFEAAQTHFLSDVFVAVAVLVIKLPNVVSVRTGLETNVDRVSYGDGNENGKSAIGLDWQNNNLSRAPCFFVHFFAVTARLRLESA